MAPSHGPTAGDSVVVVTGLNFALGSHYICSFGGSRVPASHEGTRSDQTIFCLAPPMPQGFASVEVSLNGQQFSSSTVDYSFQVLPVVRRITPPRGPPSGQTLIAVYADHLERHSQRHLPSGTGYFCRFSTNSSVVPATYNHDMARLECITPRLRGGRSVPVEITTNGQDFSITGRAYWVAASLLIVSTVQPETGIFAGGNPMTLHGTGFEFGFRIACKFGTSSLTSAWSHANFNWSGSAMPPAAYLSEGTARCSVPSSLTAGHAQVFSDNRLSLIHI